MPRVLAQRPGLTALDYRVGTHSMFFETMLADIGTESVALAESEVPSWLLEPGHIVDVPRLLDRLATATDPAIEHLWSQFSDDEKTALVDPGSDHERVLLDRLNSVLRGTSLYTPERFGHLSLMDRVLDLATAASLTGAQRTQLNRLLLEAALGNHVRPRQSVRPLERLTTRDRSDFSIALLDGWAVVADVVSFYQERIANEGYLRTAVERRSILELARLIGYELGAGVAASVFLAFTLQDGHEVEIPAGTRSQSTPDPNELPQPFETSDRLLARSEWNLLKPRMTRPQVITRANAESIDRIYFEGTKTALKKNDALLITFGPVDPVLRTVTAVEPDEAAARTLVRLAPPVEPPATAALSAVLARHSVLADFSINRGVTATRVLGLIKELQAVLAQGKPATILEKTRATTKSLRGVVASLAPSSTQLRAWLSSLVDAIEGATVTASAPQTSGSALHSVRPTPGLSASAVAALGSSGLTAIDSFRGLELGESLARPRTVQPANTQRLDRAVQQSFARSADTLPQLLTRLQPAYRQGLYDALTSAAIPSAPVEVFAFRIRSPLYGHNAPQRPLTFNQDTGAITTTGDPTPFELFDRVDLAQPYEQILPGSWVSVFTPGNRDQRPDRRVFAHTGPSVELAARADYGITSSVTRLHLVQPGNPGEPVSWFASDDEGGRVSYTEIRETTVLAQAEPLVLAEEPILAAPNDDHLEPISGDTIELGGLYEGLEPGRWLIVAGTRADIAGVDAVDATELVMVAGVTQFANPGRPGDRLHTVLNLAGTGSSGHPGLSYQYQRESVRLYGNVVKATHGETVVQPLGSGDGTKSFQTFALGRKPLTHISAPTAEGSEAALDVRVNGVLWDKSPSLIELGATDRSYIARTDDDSVTSIIFGDGEHGGRLPTGGENVVATYRAGIGLAGNVAPRKIDMLIERPLGVKEVINPLEASGGADRDSRDQARTNAPLAVLALDRLVSVQDYADFARTFAGVAKADAQLLSIGRRGILHLTLALAGDGSFDRNADFYVNLRRALSALGDPRMPVQIDHRELRLVVASARVRIDRAYLWELVEPAIRARLHDVLGFERQQLGRGLASSQALSAIHQVRGVDYVDLDVFDWVDEERILAPPATTGAVSDLASSLTLNAAVHAQPARLEGAGSSVRPAQLAYLSPDVRETLILQELV